MGDIILILLILVLSRNDALGASGEKEHGGRGTGAEGQEERRGIWSWEKDLGRQEGWDGKCGMLGTGGDRREMAKGAQEGDVGSLLSLPQDKDIMSSMQIFHSVL